MQRAYSCEEDLQSASRWEKGWPRLGPVRASAEACSTVRPWLQLASIFSKPVNSRWLDQLVENQSTHTFQSSKFCHDNWVSYSELDIQDLNELQLLHSPCYLNLTLEGSAFKTELDTWRTWLNTMHNAEWLTGFLSSHCTQTCAFVHHQYSRVQQVRGNMNSSYHTYSHELIWK